ncbi:hypothetical protein SAE01_40510 [Segetibacter aerophilus]|uniref:Uncharacterized protein n=1 Tax=Segetibacter aerophilus TaxID=670293 RepID=A0A512BI61_9BACT|nr:hypothetical protein SAE01_40510 [Segetibacter aerophilus]
MPEYDCAQLLNKSNLPKYSHSGKGYVTTDIQTFATAFICARNIKKGFVNTKNETLTNKISIEEGSGFIED